MGTDRSIFIHKGSLSLWRDARGLSLLLIVFLMAALGMAAVGVLTFGAKLREVEKDRITPVRMEAVRRALQRYYLSHQNLPSPAPDNRVPAAALGLPQEYRFDSNGQFIHYDCVIAETGTADIRGLSVRGEAAAAVLVAAGPDRILTESRSPYSDPAAGSPSSDDVVLGVSLNAEAVKIASRAVAVLQAAAKAHDGQYRLPNNWRNPYPLRTQFNLINNDGDVVYDTDYTINDQGTPDDPADDTCDNFDPEPVVPIDEGIGARFTSLEAGYVPAGGVSGTNCIKYGQLTNDPNRGTASLDACPDTAAREIAAVFGLGERHNLDPWGNPYVWGTPSRWNPGGNSAGKDILDQNRDRHHWAFYSRGPDGLDDPDHVQDDITPTTDFIDGWDATEEPDQF